MPLARGLVIGSICLLALAGCREEPECNERNVVGGTAVVVECSTGKVPVCGTDPEQIYNPTSGALLPVPSAELSADGSCPSETRLCRPRPTCGAVGQKAMCANGETAVCVLGSVREIAAPMTMPDGGPPPADAGPGDADGGVDAGDGSDAGPETDAGTATDAGPDVDGGPGDAG